MVTYLADYIFQHWNRCLNGYFYSVGAVAIAIVHCGHVGPLDDDDDDDERKSNKDDLGEVAPSFSYPGGAT